MDLLYLRNHQYYFRYQLPQTIRALCNQHELKICLHTRSKTEARSKAAPLYEAAHQIKLLHQGLKMADVTEQQVRQELDRILKEKITRYRGSKMPRSHLEIQEAKKHARSLMELAQEAHMVAPNVEAPLGDLFLLKWDLKEDGISEPPGEELLKAVAEKRREMALKFAEYVSTLYSERKDKVDALDAIASYYENPNPKRPRSIAQTAKSPLLSTLLPEFRDYKLELGQWRESRIAEFYAPLQEFLDIVEDQPIDHINRQVIRDYLDKLIRLPRNRSRSNRYKNKSIEKLLKMDIPQEDLLSTKTIQGRKAIITQFFSWCVEEKEVIDTNPLRNISVKKGNPEERTRDPFSQDELRALFNPKVAITHNKTWKFWCPLIALYSGSRQAEHSQLLKSDIKCTSGGVWYFDFCLDTDGDKSLKSKASKRKTPIHKDLINLGFIDYVNALPEGSRLYPDLNKGTRGWGQPISKWFNGNSASSGFKNKVGIKDQSKNYHSFRHTTTSYLSYKVKAPHDKVQNVIGHDTGKNLGVTARYSHPEVEDLAGFVDALDFGLDIAGLKAVWEQLMPLFLEKTG